MTGESEKKNIPPAEGRGQGAKRVLGHCNNVSKVDPVDCVLVSSLANSHAAEPLVAV